MKTITVKQPSGTRSIVLDKSRSGLFTRELGRIKKYFPEHKFNPKIGIAADCEVIIDNGKTKTIYLIFGRSVIVHPKSGKCWQFYFGLQLLEWLYM